LYFAYGISTTRQSIRAVLLARKLFAEEQTKKDDHMKYSISALALGAAMLAGAAQAADLPSRKAPPPAYIPPPPPIFTWTGFYAGLNLGGGWSASSNNGDNSYLPYTDPNVAGSLFILPGGGTVGRNTGGVIGGGQAGYNYQFGSSFLVGVETDFQGTSITGGNQGNYAGLYPSPLTPGGVLVPLATGNNGNLGLPWFGTVRGRVGWLVTPSLLLYGTGGFAYGNVTAFNQSNTRTGWTAGGGAEWLFNPNWSAKVEYLFTDLSSGGVTGGWGYDYGYHRHPQFNTVRAGLNYHFNWGPPAPVLAKY
jgi:outer membrane immunogenic protein